MVSVPARVAIRANRFVAACAAAMCGALACSSVAFGDSVGSGPATPLPASEQSGTSYWPTHGWRISSPEAQGIDSRVLAAALDAIRARHIPVNSLLIERHGEIVLDASFYPYNEEHPHQVFSVTKSVTASLVGIAIAESRLGSLDTPVSALLPGQVPADADKPRITLAHLLSMTSGLDCSNSQGLSFLQAMEQSRHWASYALDRPEVAAPGSRFDYCAGNMQIVSAVLTRATGQSAADYAMARLFAPLGITEVSWPKDSDGNSHGFADLRLSPRDMAKLGYLWLHHGVWEGKQIIPAAYLQDALTAHASVESGVQYGYGMWIYPQHGHAGGPPDFEANGVGGQRIAVVPSEDLVEVITGQGLDANAVASLTADAVRSDGALPENAQAFGRLETDVAEARTGGVPQDTSIVLAAVEPKPRPEPSVTASEPASVPPAFAVTPKPRPEFEIAAAAAAPEALPAVTPRPRPAIVPAQIVADAGVDSVRPKPRPQPLAEMPGGALVATNAPAPRASLDVAASVTGSGILRVAVAPKPRPGS